MKVDFPAYLRFLGWAAAVATAVGLLAYWPTLHLAGREGVPGLVAGCAIGVVASALGGVPVLLLGTRGPAGIVAAMGVRFVVALGLALVAALSGGFAKGPLLLGVALSYLALLVPDTRFALYGVTSEEEK